MSQQKEATLGNGAAIVERFGGIRPMASKISVAVTTVQGWKKRDAIPVRYTEQIKQAARQYGIDISDILNAALIANENAMSDIKVAHAPPQRTVPRKPDEFAVHQPVSAAPTRPQMPPAANTVYDDFSKKLFEAERKAVAKSAIINIALLVVTAGVAALLFWPQSPIGKNGLQMAALQEKVAQLRVDVAGVRQDQQQLNTYIPSDIEKQITQLQQQVQTVSKNVTTAATEVFGPGTLEQRVAQLEHHVTLAANSVAHSSALAGIMERYLSMQSSSEGEQQLSQAWSALENFMSGYQGPPEGLASGLQMAVMQNPSLNATIGTVPPQDMKAAAMLFAMAQVRGMLDRDNVPMEKDLQILKNLAGPDDPELIAALDRLAPLAGAQGVMTVDGLTSQFQSIGNEVIEASLKGENVSVTDVAKAHLGQILQVEKNGQLVSGTPAQATVARTQSLLDQGDLAAAVTMMQGLQGPAATAAVPWLANANATLAAQKLKSTLTNMINAKVHGAGRPGGLYAPARIVQ